MTPSLSVAALRGLLLQCREGFEPDLAAEMADLASRAAPDGTPLLPAGFTKAAPRTGYVVTAFSGGTPDLSAAEPGAEIEAEPAAEPGAEIETETETGARARARAEGGSTILPPALTSALREGIFPRQTWLLLGRVTNLPEEAKAAPLAEAVATLLGEAGFSRLVRGVAFEAPDTNEGKELLAFCKGFAPHFERALGRLLPQYKPAGRPAPESEGPGPDLRLFFTGWKECHVGVGIPGLTSPFPQGIPRLKFPPQAPSRSTLKLEEAFLTLLTEAERTAFLKSGLTAVDLGAAPGGWTYQFVRRDMHVIAVDNGAVDAGLLGSGLVEHRREDGFRFRPRKPVDWLVCDMVEQPARVARLASDWVRDGAARRAIFNLKLPMKSRYAEVSRCLEAIRADLRSAGVRPVVRCRHLFHDREEVTCYLARADDPA